MLKFCLLYSFVLMILPILFQHAWLLLPRVHAQGVKQSVLSVVCCLLSVVVTKIARSRVLAICACYNYHGLVDVGEKLVSMFVELLNMAH